VVEVFSSRLGFFFVTGDFSLSPFAFAVPVFPVFFFYPTLHRSVETIALLSSNPNSGFLELTI